MPPGGVYWNGGEELFRESKFVIMVKLYTEYYCRSEILIVSH